MAIVEGNSRRSRLILAACLATAAAGWLLSGPASAGSVWLPGMSSDVSVPAKSIQERKFSRVVRQKYDFSCGSAALATLLTYHYEHETDEEAAFRWMYERGDKAKISQVGFSLLDMKGYLESNGYQADGYEASLDVLAEAQIPAIALINVRGYRHFVVVKGMADGEVLVGDPAAGLRFMPRAEFEAMWANRILFIIRNQPAVGKRNYSARADWDKVGRSPFGMAVPLDSLSSLTVSLPGYNEF